MARAASEDMTASAPPSRSRFQGVAEVVRFNWPYYALAAVVILAGGTLAARMQSNASLILWAGVILAAYWLLASILVTFYVYDVSELYSWGWLARLLGSKPVSWANFHAGLDETSEAFRALFPGSASHVFDIYDSSQMTEPSIERARSNSLSSSDRPILDGKIPLEDSQLEAAFVIFAAHELRSHPERVKFFNELARVLKMEGHLVLVEHLRDFKNFAAYGPAFKHFFSRREWLSVAQESGLAVQTESSIAGFVHCFIFSKGRG
jgi:SAM-dependent methyltransferase